MRAIIVRMALENTLWQDDHKVTWVVTTTVKQDVLDHSHQMETVNELCNI